MYFMPFMHKISGPMMCSMGLSKTVHPFPCYIYFYTKNLFSFVFSGVKYLYFDTCHKFWVHKVQNWIVLEVMTISLSIVCGLHVHVCYMYFSNVFQVCFLAEYFIC